jgi:HAD superfamily hydrolase (TIGR01509 family)
MLVIFDCDGVLVESEHLAAEAFSQLLAENQIYISPAECEALFVGKTLAHCMDDLKQRYPGRLPVDFREKLDVLSDELFSQRLQAVQNVEPVLNILTQRRIAMAVASNGGIQKVNLNLVRTGLAPYFGANVFSAEGVPQPKPAPDVYLAAAEALGVPSQFCCVIEDSDLGAKAGLAAGMRVLLFRPHWRAHTTEPPLGAEVFRDMAQVLGLIFNLETSVG